MSKARDRALTNLKESLVGRYGSEYQGLIEAEVEGRLAGRAKMERQDLDAIEQNVLAARKQRRGGGGQPKSLSRSAPVLSGLSASASAPQLASTVVPGESRPRPGSTGSRLSGASQLLRTSASAVNTQTGTFNPKKVRRPAPYGTSILADDDNMSDRSRVKVNPKFPVPLPPKLKPMDHWDLIVAFDTLQHRKEDDHFRQVGKHQQHAKFKNVLDEQMEEFRQMQGAEEKARQKERQDMLAQIEENKRIAQAEKDALEAQRDKMKKINDESLDGLRRRRQAEEDKRQRDQNTMLTWLANEERRMKDQKQADAEEHARKAQKAREEMQEAMLEAERRKKARQEEEKAYNAGQQQAADDAESKNRAAVQARMDQIERNCQTIGAEIAGRDARMEAELQAKIKRIQEESDRAAKEDAARRKADRDSKVKDMLDTLGKQMEQREEDAKREKDAGIKQAAIFKKEYEDGLASDKAKEEKARQARADLDVHLISTIRKNAVIHPRDFGAELTQKQELAYNRGLFEQMAVDGFSMDLTSKFLPQANHTGKIDPFPSAPRFTGEIHELEVQQPDVG